MKRTPGEWFAYVAYLSLQVLLIYDIIDLIYDAVTNHPFSKVMFFFQANADNWYWFLIAELILWFLLLWGYWLLMKRKKPSKKDS